MEMKYEDSKSKIETFSKKYKDCNDKYSELKNELYGVEKKTKFFLKKTLGLGKILK